MAPRVQLIAIDPARIEAWFADRPFELVSTDADILIWHPATTPRPGSGIALLPVEPYELTDGGDLEAWLDCRADAYAGDPPGLRSAIDYLCSPRPPPTEGPLRLTYLGALGTRAIAPPIGTSILVDQPRQLGRSPSCDLVTRQGPHSDQNITARIQTLVEPAPHGILVQDARSTNGTFLDTHRIQTKTLAHPGQQIALSARLHLRIDGLPPTP